MTRLKKIFLAFTKSERTTFFAATVGFVVSAAILVGLGFASATRAVPAQGGEYTQGLLGQPIYVNPVTAASETDKSLVRLIFSNINDIADKIDTSADGRTWTIHLKENLHWQDGEKLTSDDVIFTVQKIQDAQTASPLATSWQGVDAERLSELELQFTLANPYAFFADTLANLYILPKHLFVDVPSTNWKLSDYNLKPVGSGPYKFTTYEKRPDGFVYAYQLTSWQDYFGQKALVENFNFNFYSNVDDLIKNFNAGQIDAVAGLEPENLAQIKRPYETLAFHMPSYYAVFLNQSKSVPLKDQVVRDALNLATDRTNIITTVLGGHGEPAIGPIPQNGNYFDPELLNTTTSLEMASETLDAAGWAMDTDGVRKKTVGTEKVPLELTLTVPQIAFLTDTANLLQASWQKIGFKIDLDVRAPEDIAGSAIQNRDYEMLLFGNILGKSSDLFSFWHSSERFYPGLNLALYNNPNADKLIVAIRQELDDSKRTSEFNNLQKQIVGDAPAVFLYSPDYLYLASKNLHGLSEGFITQPADIFTTANAWYLKTARVLK